MSTQKRFVEWMNPQSWTTWIIMATIFYYPPSIITNLHNSSEKWALLFPLFRWRSWRLSKFKRRVRLIHLVSDKLKIWTEVLLTQVFSETVAKVIGHCHLLYPRKTVQYMYHINSLTSQNYLTSQKFWCLTNKNSLTLQVDLLGYLLLVYMTTQKSGSFLSLLSHLSL